MSASLSPASGPCDIAVVAAAALFPGSTDPAGFWRHIVSGSDLITDIPATHWRPEDYYDPDPKKPGKVYSKRGAFIPAIDFDPLAFGIPPAILSQTDATQVLTLWATRQLLETTQALTNGRVARDRVGIILGGNTTDLLCLMVAKIQRPVWENAMRGVGVPEPQIAAACDRIFASYPDWTEATFPGLLANVIAGRVANRFDFGGTNFTIDAACASSLAATAVGVQQLQLGLADLVITGAADTLNTPHMYMCFSKTPALSPTGECRPFSDRADGTMMGEGVGLLALRRLADAERDGDRIYAVIRGIGAGSDGRAKSVYAPRADGQSRTLARAYEQAGIAPRDVGLIEAHGTGTVAGDAAELEGLLQLFSAGTSGEPWCALGSLKSQFGHFKTAAGIAGLFKIVMALHHRVLPPTLHIERPTPALPKEGSPFYLSTSTRPWVSAPGRSRKAGVSSFGFGGTNFHLVAEEYVPRSGAAVVPRERLRTAAKELIPFAADDLAGLVAGVASLREEPAGRAWTSTAKRRQLAFRAEAPFRLIVLAADRAEALHLAETALARLQTEPATTAARQSGAWWFGAGKPLGSVAFLFPGQGSQYVGMGGDLACEFDAARAVWDAATAAGSTVASVVFPPPALTDADLAAQSATLTRTENAQPALGAATLALWHLVRGVGIEPAMVGGHSFGELVALRAAQVFADDAALLAASAARGRAMADAAAATAGAMIAAGADGARVQVAVAGIDGVVLANLNSPRQTVLAGSVAAINDAEAALRRGGIAATRLPVATAFHSPIVAGAVAPFAAALRDLPLGVPTVPVYHNTSAAPYPTGREAIGRALAGQLAAPVRFAEQVRAMHDAGARIFVEVGPGQVLTRLVADILGTAPHLAIPLDDRRGDGVLTFFAGLGALAAAGIPVNFTGLWQEFAEPAADPAPLSKATVKLNGTQFGKGYPNNLPGPLRAVPAAPIEAPRNESNLAPVPTVTSPASAPRPLPSSPMPTSNPAFAPATNGHGSPPALPPSAGPASIPVGGAHALVALQHNMLIALQSHQRALHESYLTYARASEVALRQLGGDLSAAWSAPTSLPDLALPAPLPAPESPAMSNGRGHGHGPSPEAVHPNGHAPGAARVLLAPAGHPPAPSQGSRAPQATPKAPPPPPAVVAATAAPAPASVPEAKSAPSVAPAPIAASAGVNPTELVFQVVAEATGYPAEMLKSEMHLEADLGIDSIKRVEIFSALSGKLPQLGEIDPGQVASLATLGAIAGFIAQNVGHGAEPVAPPAANPAPAASVESAAPRWEGRPAPGFSVPGLRAAAPAFLTALSSEIAAPLAARLAEAGLAPRIGTSPSSDTRLLISLHGLEPDGPDGSPLPRLQAAFASVRAAAAGLQQPGGILVVVCDSAQDPWGVGVAGLARTAAREWPGVRIKIIDLATAGRPAGELADAIARELFTGCDEAEVRLAADGGRQVLTWSVLAPPAAAAPCPVFHDSRVWLVSGGARGVTPACLAALAARGPARFALLGRTPLAAEPDWAAAVADEAALKRAFLQREKNAAPAAVQAAAQRILALREARAAIARLEAAGAAVKYFAADVTDRAAISRVVSEVRADWGPIHGVIHAAGVLADKKIVDKTDEQFQRVVAPKITGLRVLLEATRADPLSHLVAFTSVAGALGNPGQCDYALANATLDAVLAAEQERRGRDCRVRAFAWGPWDGGMVTGALRQHFGARGISLLPPAAGAEFFAEQLLSPAAVETPVATVCGPAIRAWLPSSVRPTSSVQVECWLHAWLHPWIADHCVQGVPVLPIVLAGELCSRALALITPGLRQRRLRELRALQGVRFAAEAGLWLEVTATRGDGGWYSGRVAAPEGREHYRMEAEYTAAPPAEAPAPAWATERLPAWSVSKEDFYRALFHGPRFHGVVALVGKAENAAEVEIAEPPVALDANAGAWIHACAWLDAAAQAALTHARETHGSLVLPQRVGEQEFFAPFPRAGRVVARLRRRHQDALHERWDMAYLNRATGGLITVVHDLWLLKVGALAASEVHGSR